jgi:hypothetical protein
LTAIRGLTDADFDALSTGSVLDLARKLDEDIGFSPSAFMERLSTVELQLVTGVASESQPHVKDDAEECVRVIKRARLEREYAGLQGELNRLQERHSGAYGEEFTRLLERKKDLLQEIAKLKFD